MVVQRRQGESVMHVQSHCFANLALFFFAGLVVVLTCMFGSMATTTKNPEFEGDPA